jgi:hypothetical protein
MGDKQSACKPGSDRTGNILKSRRNCKVIFANPMGTLLALRARIYERRPFLCSPAIHGDDGDFSDAVLLGVQAGGFQIHERQGWEAFHDIEQGFSYTVIIYSIGRQMRSGSIAMAE